MTSDALLEELRGFLFHFYDPAYDPGASVRTATGCTARSETDCCRSAIIRAIESLRPAPETPPGSRATRLYQLLIHRFVENRTQEETSEIQGLTPRHLRREERVAISLLAHRLTESSAKALPDGQFEGSGPFQSAAHNPSGVPSPDWGLQLQQELTSLQRSEKSHSADVAEVVFRATELCRPLGKARGIDIFVEPIEPGLRTVISSSVLRQVLLMALEVLIEQSVTARVTISCTHSNHAISLELSGSALNPAVSPNFEEVRQSTATEFFSDR